MVGPHWRASERHNDPVRLLVDVGMHSLARAAPRIAVSNDEHGRVGVGIGRIEPEPLTVGGNGGLARDWPGRARGVRLSGPRLSAWLGLGTPGTAPEAVGYCQGDERHR